MEVYRLPMGMANVVTDGLATIGEAAFAGIQYLRGKGGQGKDKKFWAELGAGTVVFGHELIRNLTDTTRWQLDLWFAARLLSLPGESRGPAFEIPAALFYAVYLTFGAYGICRMLLSRHKNYAGKASGVLLRFLELESAFASTVAIGLASILFMTPSLDLEDKKVQKFNLIFFYAALPVLAIPSSILSKYMTSIVHRYPILSRMIQRIMFNASPLSNGDREYIATFKEVSTMQTMTNHLTAIANATGAKYWYNMTKSTFLMNVDFVRGANRLHFLLEFLIPSLQNNRNSNLLFTIIGGFMATINAACIALHVPYAKRAYRSFRVFGLSLENIFTVGNFGFMLSILAALRNDWQSDQNARLSFVILLFAWLLGLPSAIKQVHDDYQLARMFNPAMKDKKEFDAGVLSKINLVVELNEKGNEAVSGESNAKKVTVGKVCPRGKAPHVFGKGCLSNIFTLQKVPSNVIEMTNEAENIYQRSRYGYSAGNT